MSLLFCDSFDHYNVIINKWDTPGGDCNIRLNTGVSRTGIGCLQINSAAQGPTKTFPKTTDLLVATAWYSDSPGSVLRINNTDADVGFNSTCVILVCNGDRSLSAIRGPSGGSAVLGTSAAGLVTFNTYNALAIESQVSQNATIRIWCNGALVLTITGADTRNLNLPGLHYANGFGLMGPGGIPTCYHDDVVAIDTTIAPYDTFPGAVRIYAQVPTSDASVAWVPSTGVQNFACVDEIPPNGDTDYVSSATIGAADQYTYNLPGFAPASQIQAVQHTLDMEVDTGSRSVASDVGGVIGPSFPLATGYSMYESQYALNPATGVPWVSGDFPALFGPIVTL